MDCIKSSNIFVNTLLFPGSLTHSSYDAQSYADGHQESHLIYIPYDSSYYIPAILVLAEHNIGSLFCIHFHGNACDIGQIVKCGIRESHSFHAHYLIVEYPRYGIMKGMPSESLINKLAKAVHKFVVTEMKIDPSKIMLIGRSIGTGPTCQLASYLESQNKRPAAVILQSPFCSVKDAALDLIGSIGLLVYDRWENWRSLCGDGTDRSQDAVIKCPVLLIHADCDQVIDYHHSLMLNEARVSAGFPCEIFTQVSTLRQKKDHNHYDFNADYIAPVRAFIAKNITADQHHQASATSTSIEPHVVSLSLDLVESLKVIPSQYTIPVQKHKCNGISTFLWFICPCSFCCECGASVTCMCVDSLQSSFCQTQPTRRFRYIPKTRRLRGQLQKTSSVSMTQNQAKGIPVRDDSRYISVIGSASGGRAPVQDEKSPSKYENLRNFFHDFQRQRVTSITGNTANNEVDSGGGAGSTVDAAPENIQLKSSTAAVRRRVVSSSGGRSGESRLEELLAAEAVTCFENPVTTFRHRRINRLIVHRHHEQQQQKSLDLLALSGMNCSSPPLPSLAADSTCASAAAAAAVDHTHSSTNHETATAAAALPLTIQPVTNRDPQTLESRIKQQTSDIYRVFDASSSANYCNSSQQQSSADIGVQTTTTTTATVISELHQLSLLAASSDTNKLNSISDGDDKVSQSPASRELHAIAASGDSRHQCPPSTQSPAAAEPSSSIDGKSGRFSFISLGSSGGGGGILRVLDGNGGGGEARLISAAGDDTHDDDDDDSTMITGHGEDRSSGRVAYGSEDKCYEHEVELDYVPG